MKIRVSNKNMCKIQAVLNCPRNNGKGSHISETLPYITSVFIGINMRNGMSWTNFNKRLLFVLILGEIVCVYRRRDIY